jgi:hypothetical protein
MVEAAGRRSFALTVLPEEKLSSEGIRTPVPRKPQPDDGERLQMSRREYC